MRENNVKSLQEFLDLDYRFEVTPYENEEYEEYGYVISSPDLPGLEVFGETMDEALEEFREAKKAWYFTKEARGIEIKRPKDYRAEPSGRVTLRMSVSTHADVQSYAEFNKVSLNSAINELLIKGLERTNTVSYFENVLKEVSANLKTTLPYISLNHFDNQYAKKIRNRLAHGLSLHDSSMYSDYYDLIKNERKHLEEKIETNKTESLFTTFDFLDEEYEEIDDTQQELVSN